MSPPHIPQNISKKKVPSSLRRWAFIEWLIKANKWETGAELGLWKGKTTEHLLRTCPDLKLIGVDLWNGVVGNEYVSWDHEKCEKVFRDRVAPYQDRLTVIRDWTVKAAERIPDYSLDFVFIDADHSEEGVRNDIIAWLPKIKRTGCIMGHDINWKSVRAAVDALVPCYLIGPDVVWFRPVSPPKDWEKAWQ